MQIIEVTDKKTRKEFLKMPHLVYKDDPVWVCQLDSETEAIFDPAQNSFFTHGEAIRWVLKNEDGVLIGRIAAFINRNKAYKYHQPTGGIGFFECINDRQAAFLLFNTSRQWLSERGMEAMDGPVNFGENDINWGLLVEGFTHPGLGMNYNPPYYQELFESYGFKFYFEQITNHLNTLKPFPERFWKIADWVMKRPGYSFRHFTFREQDKFISDLKNIYDSAWAFHESYTPIDVATLRKTLEKSKAFLDEQMIWFAYYNEDPAAFLVMFPDVNQIIKYFKGKMNLWNMIRFLYYKRTKVMDRTRIVIMGVKPEYQKNGLESGIFRQIEKLFRHDPRYMHYREMELSWVGDFNPKMRALHESVGAEFAKKHITYRMLFSDDLDFQRSVIIPMDTKEKKVEKK
jgi:hypothetical protein